MTNINDISPDDRNVLTSSLKRSFPVDKKSLKCMEHLGKTFVQQFAMNSHLLSCINEQKSDDETPSENSDGDETPSENSDREEAKLQQESLDRNGIHRFLSVMVVEKKNKKGGRHNLSCARWSTHRILPNMSKTLT